mmetsp:Transcript_29517/g.94667  ORF Transcript_29517/g.94667 Transcript_29517/m.94667 type:complete len:370 (+) Transcript_29517:112-1221(+)
MPTSTSDPHPHKTSSHGHPHPVLVLDDVDRHGLEGGGGVAHGLPRVELLSKPRDEDLGNKLRHGDTGALVRADAPGKEVLGLPPPTEEVVWIEAVRARVERVRAPADPRLRAHDPARGDVISGHLDVLRGGPHPGARGRHEAGGLPEAGLDVRKLRVHHILGEAFGGAQRGLGLGADLLEDVGVGGEEVHQVADHGGHLHVGAPHHEERGDGHPLVRPPGPRLVNVLSHGPEGVVLRGRLHLPLGDGRHEGEELALHLVARAHPLAQRGEGAVDRDEPEETRVEVVKLLPHGVVGLPPHERLGGDVQAHVPQLPHEAEVPALLLRHRPAVLRNGGVDHGEVLPERLLLHELHDALPANLGLRTASKSCL